MEVPEDFDKLPYYFEVPCDYCGTPFITTKQRALQNKTQCCSTECRDKLRKEKTEPNCSCVVCGKPLHRKLSYIKKTKNITCSYDCCYKLKKITMAGGNNHQFGLKGALNASFKTGEKITHYGYKKISYPNHPFCDCDGYVFEHRLIAELYLLDDYNSEKINDVKFLSKEYVVHHLDFDRLNNDSNNLAVMKKNDHVKFHNSLK